jgi:uncharacterized protein (TIGR00106 family)
MIRMAIVAVNMVPLGMGSSVSKYVAAAEKVIVDRPGIKRQVGPMFTTLEGDLDEIMKAIREMQESVFETGVDRVITTIKIDDRRDKKGTMEDKLASLNAKLEGEA